MRGQMELITRRFTLCNLQCSRYWLLLFLLLCAFAPAAKADVENTILVKFSANATPAYISEIESTHGLTFIKEVPLAEIRIYQIANDANAESIVNALLNEAFVEQAECDQYIRPQEIPTDPNYAEMWGLNDTGQTVNGLTGSFDVDIDHPESLDIYEGGNKVVVAVVDSGVALDHPELNPNLWRNQGEQLDGIDNDANGFVDDIVGWDFFDNDNLPFDENGHGTLVASTIAARFENGEGATGVAPRAEIMSLRAGNDFGSLSLSATLDAFVYAALNGARIINYSAGGYVSSTLLDNLITSLDNLGILLVVAAGNGGPDAIGDNNDLTPVYPASYSQPNIISVAASQRDGALSSFSNFGQASVDVSAPGVSIFGADVARALTFIEDFETGAGGWTQGQNAGSQSTLPWSLFSDTESNTWITDSIDMSGGAVDYEASTDSWAQSPQLSIPPVGPRLEYRTFYDLENTFDWMFVEASTDQVNWSVIDAITGFSPIPTFRTADLSDFEGLQTHIRFRLISDTIVQRDGVYIDDVRITANTVFSYTGQEYQYLDGTSFAAPIVAGVAAMVWSERPYLTHTQVKNIVLNSSEAYASLATVVLSGGLANANNAIQAAQTFPKLRVPADRDADGDSDLLLRDFDGGSGAYFGVEMVSGGARTVYPPNLFSNLDWEYKTLGDFDGDGDSDLLVRNRTTGAWRIFDFEDGLPTGNRGTGGLFTNQNWTYEAIGDFDADGDDDVILRNSGNGAWRLFRMQDGFVNSFINLGLFKNSAWQTVGAGDLDADNDDDFVLRNNTTGAWRSFEIEAGAVVGVGNVPGVFKSQDWSFVALDDFDADADSDILVRNNTTNAWRRFAIENAAAPGGAVNPGLFQNPDFRVYCTGDYDLDGDADTVGRFTSTGAWRISQMQSGQIVNSYNPGLSNSVPLANSPLC